MEDAHQASTTVGTAPGKVILFGEHAVVYGQPAIAVPVMTFQARAVVSAGEADSGVWLVASDLPAPDGCGSGCRYRLCDAADDDPLRAAVELALIRFGGLPKDDPLEREPDIAITITSTIPIARGLGSGAAVATAVVRALAGYFGRRPACSEVSALVYEVEKLHHGTPSGIDNTVIAYERPVYFARGEGMTPLRVGSPFTLVIADSGVPSSTRLVVEAVRHGWQADPQRYHALFNRIGDIARQARGLIEQGDRVSMARLMDENQALLVQLGVSSRKLDRLVAAARAAGALGAKLSGAGRGGYMLAVPGPGGTTAVVDALKKEGAAQVMVTEVS
jgi:mevalonate kinase